MSLTLVSGEEWGRATEDQTVIEKYQSADLIFRELLHEYSEKADLTYLGRKKSKGEAFIYSFTSVNGGAGASTIAASCAIALAKTSRVLYLNFERYGSADQYFSGEGNYSFEEVLLSLKSKRNVLQIKFESALKKSAEGVSFLSSVHHANDISTFTPEEINRLLEHVKKNGMFDFIILDIDSDITETFISYCNQSDKIIIVEDGTETGRVKFSRYFEVLNIKEKDYSIGLINKIAVFYNKFSRNQGSFGIYEKQIEELGGVPRHEGTDYRSIIKRISEMEVLLKFSLLKEVEYDRE